MTEWLMWGDLLPDSDELCVHKRASGVIAVGSANSSDVSHEPKPAFQ
jgi:hypothetical protein